MKNTGWGFLLFIGLFAFYLHHVAPSVTTGDSGEFMTAAATLSLPHAPSFPLYTLAAKSFITLMPFGSIPYRCNVFSALTSAGACVIFFLIGLSMEGGRGLSLLTALLIGASASFWENSLVTEVFSLNTLFVALLFLCLLKRSFLLFSFLMGLGLGNHQILLFIAPALMVAAFPWRQSLFFLLFGLLGFSIYLALPIRSAQEPPLNWGQPTNVQKLVHTISRKDYGSLKLALGDAPERNGVNTLKHIRTFVRHLGAEAPWPIWFLALAGIGVGFWQRERFVWILAVAFVASGPFFFWLGNLPFVAQSDGIVGRFLIIPVVALLLGIPFLFRHRRGWGILFLSACLLMTFQKNVACAQQYRSTTLVLDYGRAMMRTLPVGSFLYMDGGDDAFYSMAMLRYVMNKRPDLHLFDRGGLIFKSPYGSDFRSLPKEAKQVRRLEVERSSLSRGPVFYSTMDNNILPGSQLNPAGFLLKVGASSMDWSLLILRSLYPLEPNVYRMRALGVFFPFMQGRQYLGEGRINEALAFFQRAQEMGEDVDWFKNNLGVEYARLAYAKLLAGEEALSERIYRQWISFEPLNLQAQSNLGVVLEKSNRLQEAKEQYEKTAKLFPSAPDPVFNLAVLAWKEGDWARVVIYLEEVLKRKPDHPQAESYLKMARERLRRS